MGVVASAAIPKEKSASRSLCSASARRRKERKKGCYAAVVPPIVVRLKATPTESEERDPEGFPGFGFETYIGQDYYLVEVLSLSA